MNRVKDKATPILRRLSHSASESRWLALGAVDLHLHGGFGTDVMIAGPPRLDQLAIQLSNRGVSAFLPTTLSAGIPETEAAISRLGQWIRSKQRAGPHASAAFPLGIHLEGPFLSRRCCGAHPEAHLIAPSLELLRRWQKLSGGTIAKVTLAPEAGSWPEVRKILKWAATQEISVSLGHSNADSARVRQALRAGANSLTHAWNAMPFHHRSPGILGEALGRDGLFIEIIPDNVHVSDTVVDWTMKLHPTGVCLVSDAVPAAHFESWASFGPLQVVVSDGAGRTADGALAGGALTLLDTARGYWARRSATRGKADSSLAKGFLESLTVWPLLSLPGARRWIARLNACHVREYRLGRRMRAGYPLV